MGRLGEKAKVYAGGAELLLLMRHEMIQAEVLVNIKPIGALGDVSWDGQSVHIGATATHHRLERDPLVLQYLPMLAYTESQIANIRVRNQGTLGGNLCFSDPHSDPGTALLVYETMVSVGGKNGSRQIALNDFLVGMYTTGLKPEELMQKVLVSPLPPGWGSAYLRIHRLQRPTLGVAAAAKMRDGLLDGVRIAVGCIGPKPQRLEEVEARLRGLGLADAKRVLEESKPYLIEKLEPVADILGSAEYKIYMAAVLIRRALEQAGKNRSGELS